jgi:hypothetical protein
MSYYPLVVSGWNHSRKTFFIFVSQDATGDMSRVLMAHTKDEISSIRGEYVRILSKRAQNIIGGKYNGE